MRPLHYFLEIGAVACFAGCTVGPDYHEPKTKVTRQLYRSVGDWGVERGRIEQASHRYRDVVGDIKRLGAELAHRACDKGEPQSRNRPHSFAGGENVRGGDYRAGTSRIGSQRGAGRGTGSNLTRGRVSPPLNSASNTAGLHQINYLGGFDATWEIDMFGRYRRAIEAARYDTQAAAAARNVVLITVVADVTRAYVDMRGLQMQLAVLRQNIRTAQQSVDLVQARFDRGIINELDVTLARRQLATFQSQVAPLAAQITAAQYAIAVLIGQFPEDVAKELEQPGLVPQVPEKIDAGLPLDLIRRRPDIREAERQLAGATARIGVATANLFPRVAITAGAGGQGQGLGVTPVVNQSVMVRRRTSDLAVARLWHAGCLVDVADLRTHALLVNYKQTVLNAVQEVDTAITGYAAQQDRLRNLGDALAASQRAVSLARSDMTAA